MPVVPSTPRSVCLLSTPRPCVYTRACGHGPAGAAAQWRPLGTRCALSLLRWDGIGRERPAGALSRDVRRGQRRPEAVPGIACFALIFTCVCARVSACIYVSVSVQMYFICIRTCMYVYACMSLCCHVSMCMCVCVYMPYPPFGSVRRGKEVGGCSDCRGTGPMGVLGVSCDMMLLSRSALRLCSTRRRRFSSPRLRATNVAAPEPTMHKHVEERDHAM
jgi:hypothetical protein